MGANLAFHRYHLDYRNVEDIEKEQEKDLHIFRLKGIKQEFIEKLYDASHEALWIPSIDELLSAGVIHGVLDPSDSSIKEASGVSTAEKEDSTAGMAEGERSESELEYGIR